MIIVIRDKGVQLTEADDFRKFSLDAAGLTLSEMDAALRAGGAGYVRGDDAFIGADFLCQHAPETGERESWLSQLQGMIDYAESKGWLSVDASVQAHIENAVAE